MFARARSVSHDDGRERTSTEKDDEPSARRLDLFRRPLPHLMLAHELEAFVMTTEERMQRRIKSRKIER